MSIEGNVLLKINKNEYKNKNNKHNYEDLVCSEYLMFVHGLISLDPTRQAARAEIQDPFRGVVLYCRKQVGRADLLGCDSLILWRSFGRILIFFLHLDNSGVSRVALDNFLSWHSFPRDVKDQIVNIVAVSGVVPPDQSLQKVK